MVLHLNLSCLVLVRFSLSQGPVSIEFQTNPVLVQTGTDVLFTIINLPDVVLVKWDYPGGTTPLALWSGGAATVNTPSQYQGRVSITRNQLRISAAQLADAGVYNVQVDPSISTGLASNVGSVQLKVFVAVSGVILAVPPVAVEGKNISLTCLFATGTEVAVAWGFQGAAITPGGRISISGGSLVIDPGRRSDAGVYSCTVSNPVSARSATQTLTVYYGPDTPVLTKDRPVNCVGGGDAVLGQTITLTCVSESLPPALFSWQQDGRPVANIQPDSGVLGVQAVSANQSGSYTCLARNAITGSVSQQSTKVDVVQTCLSGGEVAGIVIGSLAALLLIILLILLLVCWRRADQRRRNNQQIQKTNGVPQQVPHAPLGNGEVVQRSDPPLHQPNHHYTLPQQYNHQTPNNTTLPPDRDPNLPPPFRHHQGNARLLPTTTTFPPDSIDNPGFSHAGAANTLSRTAPQNPNILIQGATRDGSQPPTVQVNLGPQPGGATATLPTMHFNLNSFPPSAQPVPLQPLPGTETSHTLLGDARRSDNDPRRQRSDPAGRVFGREDPGGRLLVPTGYSHSSSPRADTHPSQRHTDTYPSQQHTIPHSNTHPSHRHTDTHADRRERGPSSRSGDGGQTSTHSQGHAPWDLLRGTPAYPNGSTSTLDGSDYTTQNPPLPQTRASEPGRVNPEGRGRQEGMSDTRQTRARPPTSPSHHSHDAPRAQRERTHSHSPQWIVGETATEPRGHVTQQQPITTRSLDTRAQADPNHLLQPRPSQNLLQTLPSQPLPQTRPSQPLPQTRPSQPLPQTRPSQPLPQTRPSQPLPQTRPSQPLPQTRPSHPLPMTVDAPPTTQRHQGKPSPWSNGTPLTQEALQTHTQHSQTFQNRNQQTQAALLRPPTPPQVIPLAQFQALPRERTHDRSPNRPAPRLTANLPAGQRLHLHANPHHPRNTGHTPHAHHANRHQGHNGNPHQNQTRRERPQ
ncbi:unnamed protein product [Lota lota]